MSLATQRPNYVLIWIGIVMLTFSVMGQWLLDSGFTTPAGLVGSTRSSMDYEDSSILPGHATTATNPASSTALSAEDLFDQMIPLYEEEVSWDGFSLANQEVSIEPAKWTLFPAEAVELDPEALDRSAQGDQIQGLVPEQLPPAEPRQQLHRNKLLTTPDSDLSRRQKAKERFQDDGQYNSSIRNRGLGRSGKQRSGSDRLILVKSKFTQRGHGKIAVRFFLNQPMASQKALDRIQGLDEESSQLALIAEAYLEAMREVILEDDSEGDDANSEELSQKMMALKNLAQMKSKIRERLHQHPGGIELLAELSPEQLEALLQKLSAQDPRFRALVNS